MINTFMMVYLNYLTWIRLGIWVFIGLNLNSFNSVRLTGVVIYFLYGYRNSKEGRKQSLIYPNEIAVEKTKL
jgi:hypothetical protein